MHVISIKALKLFWDREPAAKSQLEAWFAEARRARWTKPSDIKSKYRSASILTGGRVVFNICGNQYRLVVQIRYWNKKRDGTIFIRFIGSHREYDLIDAQVI